MQPQENQTLPPVTSTPPPSVPDTPSPQSKRAMPKWVWAVIAAAVIILGLLAYFVFSLMTPADQTKKASTPEQLTTLAVGSENYIYPCSVATEADYAQIFKLDDQTVGTVSETAALPVKNITSATPDLTKIAPVTGDRYDTICAFTLAKTGATRVSRMEVTIRQYRGEKEAETNYKTLRNGEAGDYTLDNIDNGLRQLGTLPSFPDTSYVRLPDETSILPGLKAVFRSGSRTISMTYDFGPNETTGNVMPLFDEYAKAIQSKISTYKEGAPVELTGRSTLIGKKFADVCYGTNISTLGEAFGNVQFRPDQVDRSGTYGSLAGSSAAREGVKSHCKLGFNTSGDRQAQSSKRTSSTKIYADRLWPHDFNITTNSFRNADEAKAYLAAKKATASRPTQFSPAPAIEDIAGLGDGAYKLHNEYSLSSEPTTQNTLIEDTVSAVFGSDVVTIGLQQTANEMYYKTAPLKPSQSQFKVALETVRDSLAANRK